VQESLLNLVYLVAAILFILGIRDLTHPRTAVRGNLSSSLAMLIAVLATLILKDIVGLPVVLAGLVVGASVGIILATKIKMSAMPQLVALFNGFGGGASTVVAWAVIIEALSPDIQIGIASAASGIIGTVTFAGSMVAFAKLQELKSFKKPLHFTGQHLLNMLLLAAALTVAILIVAQWQWLIWLYLLLIIFAGVLGVFLVLPIGGADMPVVIALLNSFSGLAACATGFVLNNNLLIIAGSLVGASGLILTNIMCKAMNRTLGHVLFGKLGPTAKTADADDLYAGKIKATTPDEVAMLLDGAPSCNNRPRLWYGRLPGPACRPRFF